MDQQAIFEKVRGMICELFDLEQTKVQPESRFIEDLDLTSIDAIDLVVRLEELTGKRVVEKDLRRVRTVADIVALVQAQLVQAQIDRASQGSPGTPGSSGSPGSPSSDVPTASGPKGAPEAQP